MMGNDKKIRIEYIDGGFVEIIENEIVEKAVCNYNGICTVYFNDKDKPPKELNVGCSSYNRPYGIPISDDGSNWDKLKPRRVIAFLI